MKNYDVVALGELLVDFTQNGMSAQGNWLMEANPGGAPCNVLAMLAKLEHSVSFVGKVGNDMFGKMLQSKIASLGIGTENLVLSKEYKTTLAFVHTSNDGDRSFSFYRNQGADSMLESSELKSELISAAKIFHFGTLSMTNENCFNATKAALEIAKNSSVLRSFDPNLRLPLWENENQAKEKILFGLSECEILKIASEELEFVSGEKSICDGVNWLRSKFNIPLITVTKGKEGSEAFYSDGKISLHESVGTFSNVKTIDTTGAGDTFCACVLREILCNGYENFSADRLQKMLVFANAASSLVTTKKGSLSIMPERTEIEQLIKGGL
ncbi:MAG: carbohydrate kinase [Spirochaetales bacterium]|nr:carbohydrate kinase [Spirochaetales bacterium]